jgi:hypothetical protein
LETRAPPYNKKWRTSGRKGWTLNWFCPILSHLPPSVRVSVSLSKLSFRSLFRHQLLLLTSWTWVTRAEKDEGTTESCSIVTLMKITFAFYKLLFHREDLVRKSMPSIMCGLH